MYCIECGNKLTGQEKFCSECGMRVESNQPSKPSTPAPAPVQATVTTTQAAVDTEKAEIIASADTSRMSQRARAALAESDIPVADFWFLEWITAGGASSTDIGDGILAYTSELLLPNKQFSEAELYLAWLSHSTDSSMANKASAAMQEIHRNRGAYGFKRFRSSNEWKSFDVSLDLDPAWPAEKQYQRTIAWLSSRTDAQGKAIFRDRGNPQHLPYLTGLILGMKNTIQALGADWEATVQGVQDWVDFEIAEQEKITSREKTAQMQNSRPKQTNTSIKQVEAPTTNSLGEHVDKIFSDRKMADQIKTALGCTSGLNDDFIVAYFPVANKLGDGGEFYEHYMIFTKTKVAIVKKSGMFSAGSKETINKKQVIYVGIGESNHYEAQGLGGRSTEWISITLELQDGRSFTRHYYLGDSESEVNSNIPIVRDDLQRMARAGWQIEDGPAWNSSGGYRTSYGYGIGFWR